MLSFLKTHKLAIDIIKSKLTGYGSHSSTNFATKKKICRPFLEKPGLEEGDFLIHGNAVFVRTIQIAIQV